MPTRVGRKWPSPSFLSCLHCVSSHTLSLFRVQCRAVSRLCFHCLSCHFLRCSFLVCENELRSLIILQIGRLEEKARTYFQRMATELYHCNKRWQKNVHSPALRTTGPEVTERSQASWRCNRTLRRDI